MITLQSLNFGLFSFPTYYLLIFFVFLICTFFIWKESTKDGFDNERVFDLYFSLVLLLVTIKFVINYYAPYKLFVGMNRDKLLIFTFVGLSLVAVKYLSKAWKWSLYRMLDIFSALLFVFFTYMFALMLKIDFSSSHLIILITYLLVYLALFLVRRKLLSGVVFSLFLLATALTGQFFYIDNVYLLFYFILITISMVNLIYRTKKAMPTGKFNLDFVNSIKKMLSSKEKRLKIEQKKLIEEDPYLQEGRATENSEEMDEAILEDRAKLESDIKKNNITEMQSQVEKALNKLEEGEYGLCEVCGEAIDKARLEIYPEATTCVDCAAKASE